MQVPQKLRGAKAQLSSGECISSAHGLARLPSLQASVTEGVPASSHTAVDSVAVHPHPQSGAQQVHHKSQGAACSSTAQVLEEPMNVPLKRGRGRHRKDPGATTGQVRPRGGSPGVSSAQLRTQDNTSGAGSLVDLPATALREACPSSALTHDATGDCCASELEPEKAQLQADAPVCGSRARGTQEVKVKRGRGRPRKDPAAKTGQVRPRKSSPGVSSSHMRTHDDTSEAYSVVHVPSSAKPLREACPSSSSPHDVAGDARVSELEAEQGQLQKDASVCSR